MHRLSQEYTSHGTPLDIAQDASRRQEQQLIEHQSQFSRPAYPDDEKQRVHSEEESWSEGSENVDNEKNSGPVLKPVSSNTTTTNTNRPRPLSRQATTASLAAAPYIGPDCCNDIEQAFNQPGQRPSSSSSSSSVSTLEKLPSNLATASRVSTDADGNTYPEGGKEAYLCVFGSFCGLTVALGLMNTLGTFQAYLSTNQLKNESENAIGWIFGIYAFLSFFCGVQIGPVFDAKGPRWLVFAGSILFMAAFLLLGVCTQYWHFLIVIGVLGGSGTSLLFTPSVAAVGHYFLRKRGQFTGLATVGGSLGGIIFPLSLQAMFRTIGFAWATRVAGLINLVLLIFANLFIKSRLPPKKATKESMLPDARIFRDPVFTLTTLGVFFVEWGLFIPCTYLTSYSLKYGVSETFSYQIIAILNVGSCFGRYLPGLFADYFGHFNSMVLTISVCLISTLALWLPANGRIPLLIVYSLVFGFASGSGISLTPVCVGKLCKIENYGRYYATCYTIVSFGSLTGMPIAGQLITACGGAYWGAMLFTGCAYAAATITFVTARGIGTNWKLRANY